MPKLKITPAFIILGFGILLSLPATFHYFRLDNEGVIPNLGLISGGYSFLLITFLLVERTLISIFKPTLKSILIVEISIICVCSIVIGLNRSTLYLKVNNDCDWFGIYYTDSRVNTKTEYIFPHDKIINIKPNDILFLNKTEFDPNWKVVEAIGSKWNNYLLYDKEYDIGKKGFCSIYIASGQIPSDTLIQYVRTIIVEKFR